MNNDIRTQQRGPVASDALPVAQRELSERERIAAGLLANGKPRLQAFGQQTQKLAWPEIPGFVLYWANDVPGRLDELKTRGFDHVLKDGAPVSRVVGIAPDGSGLKAYLLKIPKEWYDADVSVAQEAETDKMRRIKAGRLDDVAGANQYVPQQGIKIERR